MADDTEDRLRQRLSETYPVEPVSSELLGRITELVDPVASGRRPEPMPVSVPLIAPSAPRRSWWTAAAVAVLVAAAAVVIGSAVTSDPDSPAVVADSAAPPAMTVDAAPLSGSPDTVALPTSAWTPGMAAMEALGQGELDIGADGCLHLGGAVVIWPKGYYGIEVQPGTVVVYGPDGAPRARTGETLSAGGGWLGTDPHGCTSGADGPFLLQDELAPDPALNPTGSDVDPLSTDAGAALSSAPTAGDASPITPAFVYDGPLQSPVAYPAAQVFLNPPGDATPGLSPEAAFASCAGMPGFCGAEVQPHVALATATTLGTGTMRQDGTLDPLLVDDLVYAMTWTGMTCPMSAGPMGRTTEPTTNDDPCTQVRLIDATSGAMLLEFIGSDL